jgi:hypothetical protein
MVSECSFANLTAAKQSYRWELLQVANYFV